MNAHLPVTHKKEETAMVNGNPGLATGSYASIKEERTTVSMATLSRKWSTAEVIC